MRKFLIYSVSVCLFSWTMAAIAIFGFRMTSATPWYTFFAAAYMFFPLLTALVLQAIGKEKFNHTGLVNFRISWTWLVAWLLPVAMLLVCIAVNGLVPGVDLQYNAEQLINQYDIPEEQQDLVRSQVMNMPAAMMLALTLISGLLAGVTINAVAAFGEEYGWRNYLVGALGDTKFVKAALLIGFVWGIWHAPLILLGHNYPEHHFWGVPMMVVFCMLLGIIELYFVVKTKSVIVAAIMHGTINAVVQCTTFFVLGGNDLTNGLPGLSGFITMLLTIILLYVYDKYLSRDCIFSKTLIGSLKVNEL